MAKGRTNQVLGPQRPQTTGGKAWSASKILVTAGLGKGSTINTGRFRTAAASIPDSFAVVTAEFGAYMSYSIFLESLGARRMPPRPHIRPALFGNKKFIAEYVNRFMFDRLIMAARSGTRTSPDDVSKMWTRVLNSRPREHAIDSARSQKVYRYGFHIRSIMGYSPVRSISDIKAQQDSTKRAIKDRLMAKKGSKANKRAKP